VKKGQRGEVGEKEKGYGRPGAGGGVPEREKLFPHRGGKGRRVGGNKNRKKEKRAGGKG